MLNDGDTDLQTLKNLLESFRDQRDWKQFHDPKNLAEAISIEASELQELFLWKNKDDIARELIESPTFKERVAEELADVLIFCLHFSNATGLDVASIIIDKIKKAEKKYPIDKAAGNAKKYTELETL